MGACDFMVTITGKDAADAYRKACQDAEAEYGHQDGYNGTISTTSGFSMVRTSAKELKAEITAKVARLRVRLQRLGRGKATKWERADLQREIKGLLATKKNLKANPWSVMDALIAMDRFQKWEACGCIEVTGKAAREYKARRGMKGTRQKVFVFGGLAAC
jgi:hypothetical protein